MKLSRICEFLLRIGVVLVALGLTTIAITSITILAFDAPVPEAYRFLRIGHIGAGVALIGAVVAFWGFILQIITSHI
jgi:hypothetical protein